jgi:hypothetical protein
MKRILSRHTVGVSIIALLVFGVLGGHAIYAASVRKGSGHRSGPPKAAREQAVSSLSRQIKEYQAFASSSLQFLSVDDQQIIGPQVAEALIRANTAQNSLMVDLSSTTALIPVSPLSSGLRSQEADLLLAKVSLMNRFLRPFETKHSFSSIDISKASSTVSFIMHSVVAATSTKALFEVQSQMNKDARTFLTAFALKTENHAKKYLSKGVRGDFGVAPRDFVSTSTPNVASETGFDDDAASSTVSTSTASTTIDQGADNNDTASSTEASSTESSDASNATSTSPAPAVDPVASSTPVDQAPDQASAQDQNSGGDQTNGTASDSSTTNQ